MLLVLLLLLLLLQGGSPVANGYILSGCNDPLVDVPACFLALLDVDHNGSVTWEEWFLGIDQLQFGKELAQNVDAIALFDQCDYTGEYELSIEDWNNRTWPCELSSTIVVLFCAVCQQNGWNPSTPAQTK